MTPDAIRRRNSHYMHDNRGYEEYHDGAYNGRRGVASHRRGMKTAAMDFAPSSSAPECEEDDGQQDVDEEKEKVSLQQAAALLLASKNFPSLLHDFCQPCSLLLRDRLLDLASGNFATFKGCASCEEDGSGDGDVQEVHADTHEPPGDEESPIHRSTNGGGMVTDESDATEGEVVPPTPISKVLSTAERERLRLLGIRRKKDFVCLERVDGGRLINVAAGLELHTGVFSKVEQTKLVNMVREFQEKGRRQELKERTYSEPKKWMRGKGRVTIQFGCCYNYALDKYGNPPGILRNDVVDPLPPLLRTTIKRLVRWHVLPPTCVPDSCIINIYEEGDCIPPHIDHHDFVRPFCTLSLLSKCNIVFGANLKIVGPGEFDGKLSVPLPVGSVLVLNGNGADVAKHAVPAVPTERISITFRKMDPSKVPLGFSIDNELQGLRPVVLPAPQLDSNGL